MKKFVQYIIIPVVMMMFFALSADAASHIIAPQDGTYQLLAPLPNIGPDFNPAEENALGTYLNEMIALIIGISAVLAVVMLVIGGVEYMTSELISSKEAGREKMRNAVLGLLLSLGAFILLATINPDLLNTNINIASRNFGAVVAGEDVPQLPVNGKYGKYVIGADWAVIAGRPVPLPPGVNTRPTGDCANVGQASCTSVRGLNTRHVQTIRDNCSGCGITITGGTEYWLHNIATSHGIDSPTVDLALDPILGLYITGGQVPVYYDRFRRHGVNYLFEGNHWHVY